MPRAKGAERRKFVRAKRVVSIRYRLAKSKYKGIDKSWQTSLTRDMSAGGMAFNCPQELHVGDTLEMQVIMSGAIEVFNGFGKVVRIEKKTNGRHFVVAVSFLEQPKSSSSQTAAKKLKKRPAKRI